LRIILKLFIYRIKSKFALFELGLVASLVIYQPLA
jgi:hypothetical protein